MGRVQWHAVLWVTWATLFMGPRQALADGNSSAEQTPIRIQYAAHDGCPDASEFFRRVQARTQRIRLAAAGELAESATITIQRGESGSAGTLELPPLDNRPFSRRVEAPTCDE